MRCCQNMCTWSWKPTNPDHFLAESCEHRRPRWRKCGEQEYPERETRPRIFRCMNIILSEIPLGELRSRDYPKAPALALSRRRNGGENVEESIRKSPLPSTVNGGEMMMLKWPCGMGPKECQHVGGKPKTNQAVGGAWEGLYRTRNFIFPF